MPSSPVSYPLGPPTVSGTTVTVDVALNQPTRILRDIARLTDAKFFASRVFADAGGVSGGAVLYETPPTTATDLYAERGFQEVAPMEEAPVLTFLRGVPAVAKPRKLMGKFPVSKEQRARNDQRLLQRAMVQAANTLALTLDAMAVTLLNAVITANSRTQAGQSWATAAGTTMTTRSGTNTSLSDIMLAQSVVELEQRGHTLNSILIHPTQRLRLQQQAQAVGQTIDQMLASVGITNWFASPRVTSGTALLYEAGMVGGWANEFPLQQTTWIEEKTDNTTWFQWSISPAMFIDDWFGMLQLTGLGA